MVTKPFYDGSSSVESHLIIAITATFLLLVCVAKVNAQTSPDWTTGSYSYDGAGNITTIGGLEYRYDVAGRLVRGDTPGADGTISTRRFGYDVP